MKYLLASGVALLLSLPLQAQVLPNPPEMVCIEESSQGCPETPAAPTTRVLDGVKWNPGHYVRAATVDTLNSRDARSASGAGWQGVEIQYDWSTLETSRGNYNFSLIDSHLAQLKGKMLIIHIKDRSFNGTSTSHLPRYLASEPGANGGWYVKPGSSGVVSRLWLPAVTDRWIALIKALAARYDDHPQVEMVIINNESSVSLSSGTADYTRAALATQLKRSATAATGAWQHTNVVLRTNFLSNEVSGLLKHYYTVAAGMGGPDVCPPPEKDTEAALVWRGEDTDSSLIARRDYRGSLPVSYVAASFPFTGGKNGSFSARDFYDHAYYELMASHLSWVLRDSGSAPASAISALVSKNPQMRSDCPTRYNGRCRSN